MKKNMFFLVCVTLSLSGFFGYGEGEKPEDNSKIAYMLGVDAARYINALNINLDYDLYIKGFKDALEKKVEYSDEELLAEKEKFIKMLQKAEQERFNKRAMENQKREQEFFNKNKENEGMKVLPSGVQYVVIKEGEGKTPDINATVKVHYKGTLLDGKIFDSSYQRKEPAVFPVKGVIQGWQEILTIMKTGSNYKVFIPSNLAYGERGAGMIGPNETLVFEIELLEIVS